MKILIVSSYFGNVIGGALNFIKELSLELTVRGHSVYLLLDDRYKNLFSEKEFNIIWFSSAKITYYSPSISFLKIIAKIDVDIIHLNGYLSFQTDFGALVGFLRKIPIILTPHGSLLAYDYLYDSSLSKLPYRLHDLLTLKLPAKISKYIIPTSQSEFKDCVKFGINKHKIRKIPISFSPLLDLSLEKKNSIKKIKILFVGRIVPLKNLDVVLKSIQIIKNNIHNIEFIIVGDEVQGRLYGDLGHKKQLESLIKSLDITENVQFVGWKTHDDLWKIYRDSDLFVFASIYENFGLPLLEAAYFGLPLISTDVGIASELIDENNGGEIILELKPEKFAKSILKILLDKKAYDDASKHIRSNACNFSIKFIADKYEEIFEDVSQIE